MSQHPVRRVVWTVAAVAIIAMAASPAAAADFVPTPLKVEVNANDAGTAARQLSMQFGFTVNIPYELPGGLKFTGESKPYALAVGDFFANGGLNCDGNMSQLTAGKPLRVIPIGDTAAVIISRLNLTATANRDANAGQRTSCNCTLQMAAVFDPALQFVGVGDRVVIDTLVVDNAAVPVGREGGNEPQSLPDTLGTPVSERAFSVNLSLVPTARKITRLSARLRAWQVAEGPSVDVPAEAMAAGKSSAAQDLTVTADYPADEPNVLKVTITGPALERYRSSMWGRAMSRFITPLDADNRPMPVQANDYRYDAQAKSFIVALRPPDLSGFKERLATLRVRVPTKVRCVDVPVEMTDLDLPAD